MQITARMTSVIHVICSKEMLKMFQTSFRTSWTLMMLTGESFGGNPPIVHTVGIGVVQYYVLLWCFETTLQICYCYHDFNNP